jgi:hypothetical protein
MWGPWVESTGFQKKWSPNQHLATDSFKRSQIQRATLEPSQNGRTEWGQMEVCGECPMFLKELQDLYVLQVRHCVSHV